MRGCAHVIVLLLVTAGSSVAVEPPKPIGGQPGGTLDAQPRPKIDPRPIIERAITAMKGVQALSYSAQVTTGSATEPEIAADVSAKRAEAGGWMLWAKGRAGGGSGGGAMGGDPRAKDFEIGYDGASARAVRPGERTVVEKTVTDWADLAVFFSGEGVRPAVAWEIMGESPFKGAADKAAALATAKVGDDECDVIVVPPAGGSGPDGNVTTRFYFATQDGLPRRIDRQIEGTPDTSARVLTIKNLKLNDESLAGRYSIDTPDGYRIKAADAPKPKPKDPDGVAGPAGGMGVGDVAPDFALADPSGKTFTWDDFKGKVVVIDVWGTWCGPCRMAMPGMQKIHEKYKDKPVAVLGFNFEQSKKADPAKFMADNKYTYQLLLHAENVLKAYKVDFFPTFFVVGADRKIKYKAVGADPAHEAQISKIIDRELAAKSGG